MRPITTIALMLVAILIVAGCGGGGGESDDAGGSGNAGGNDAGNADTTTPASISKAEFIEGADAVCTKAGKKAQAELASYLKDNGIEGNKLNPQQTEDVAKDILAPVLQFQVDEIRALGVPEQDQLQIVSFLSEVEAAASKAEKNPTMAIQSPDQLLSKARAIVAGYGFEVCAQGQGEGASGK